MAEPRDLFRVLFAPSIGTDPPHLHCIHLSLSFSSMQRTLHLVGRSALVDKRWQSLATLTSLIQSSNAHSTVSILNIFSKVSSYKKRRKYSITILLLVVINLVRNWKSLLCPTIWNPVIGKNGVSKCILRRCLEFQQFSWNGLSWLCRARVYRAESTFQCMNGQSEASDRSRDMLLVEWWAVALPLPVFAASDCWRYSSPSQLNRPIAFQRQWRRHSIVDSIFIENSPGKYLAIT